MQPEEAEAFVRATGVDALAIAVGTAHGIYRQTPRVSVETVDAVRERVSMSLVLHGPIGVPAHKSASMLPSIACRPG